MSGKKRVGVDKEGEDSTRLVEHSRREKGLFDGKLNYIRGRRAEGRKQT